LIRDWYKKPKMESFPARKEKLEKGLETPPFVYDRGASVTILGLG